MHKSETRRFNPFGLCGVISYHKRKREPMTKQELIGIRIKAVHRVCSIIGSKKTDGEKMQAVKIFGLLVRRTNPLLYVRFNSKAAIEAVERYKRSIGRSSRSPSAGRSSSTGTIRQRSRSMTARAR